jgi:hypothetical protein
VILVEISDVSAVSDLVLREAKGKRATKVAIVAEAFVIESQGEFNLTSHDTLHVSKVAKKKKKKKSPLHTQRTLVLLSRRQSQLLLRT